MRGIWCALVLVACANHDDDWVREPVATMTFAYEGQRFSIEVPRSLHESHGGAVTFTQPHGGPIVWVGTAAYAQAAKTLDEAVRNFHGTLLNKEQRADGHVYTAESDGVFYAERYVIGEPAMVCEARARTAKDNVARLEKMCLSLQRAPAHEPVDE